MNQIAITILLTAFVPCGHSISVFHLEKTWNSSICPRAWAKDLCDMTSIACKKLKYGIGGNILFTQSNDQPCKSLLQTLLSQCHQSETVIFRSRSRLEDGSKVDACDNAMVIKAICITKKGTTAMAMGCQKDKTVQDISNNPKWKALCGNSDGYNAEGKGNCVSTSRLALVSIPVALAGIAVTVGVTLLCARIICHWKKDAKKLGTESARTATTESPNNDAVQSLEPGATDSPSHGTFESPKPEVTNSPIPGNAEIPNPGISQSPKPAVFESGKPEAASPHAKMKPKSAKNSKAQYSNQEST